MECQAPLGLEPGRRLADPSRGFGCLAVGQACPARRAKRSARGGPSALVVGPLDTRPRCDRFSSKDENLNFGLYYYGFRWYAPGLQCWVNRDPMGERGGVTLHQAFANGPLDVIDTDGRFASALALLLIASGEGTGDITVVGIGGATGWGYGMLLPRPKSPRFVPPSPGNSYHNAPPLYVNYSNPGYRPGYKPKNRPAVTLPINKHPGRRDHVRGIKVQPGPEGGGPKSWVGVTPDGDIIVTNPDGTPENLGPVDSYR